MKKGTARFILYLIANGSMSNVISEINASKYPAKLVSIQDVYIKNTALEPFLFSYQK